MQLHWLYRWGIFPLWLLLSSSIFFRNPIPIDETRYLSVAWEMWLRNDFWVPYLNGETYSHKPPLLFWLFHLGWSILGVNEWWPRLVGPLCALVNLLMMRHLAKKLWPNDALIAMKAPWILISTLLWTLFATSTMFDILLTCCVLLGMMGLFEAAQGKALKGWSLFALAVGLGLLAKGPVILLHLLPTAVLVVIWHRPLRLSTWFVQLVIATLAGCTIALCWAIPAAAAGGEEYASAILWHQTADRTVGTKIHARSFFWYLRFVPLLVFPWIAWPRLWQNFKVTPIAADLGLRFCLVWLLSTFLIFSWLPSKQLHYLIPMLPAFGLFCSRVLCHQDVERHWFPELIPALSIAVIGLFLAVLKQVPGLSELHWVQSVEPYWGVSIVATALIVAASTFFYRKLTVMSLSTAITVSIFIGFVFFFQYTGLQYNLRPAALKVKQLQDQGSPLAFVGDYQGQFQFLGRLTQAIPIIKAKNAREWSQQHPGGYLIYLEKTPPQQADYVQPHREHWLSFRTGEQVMMSPLH